MGEDQANLLRKLYRQMAVMSELRSLPEAMRPLFQEVKATLGEEAEAVGKPSHLLVEAEVRYWEDAEVNGVEDVDGSQIPGRDGDVWRITIDLEKGEIEGWPQGTEAKIHYKVCDAGLYWLTDAEGRKLAQYLDHYVPADFLCHGESGDSDYIIFEVNTLGQIRDYEKPEIIPEQWKVLPPD